MMNFIYLSSVPQIPSHATDLVWIQSVDHWLVYVRQKETTHVEITKLVVQ